MDLTNKKKARLNQIISIVKLLILIGAVVGVPLYIYFQYPELVAHFKSMEDVNAFLEEHKTNSVLIYIGLQIFQIVVSVIPGQILQFAAGYAYAFWMGFLFSMIGIALGTIVTFYLARILGKDAMHIFFGEEKINQFIRMLNSKKAYTILFVLFVIPGFPKDLVTYAAGVSEIRIRAFLFLSLVGRTPALMVTIMMGSMFYNGSYTGLIVLAALAVISFIVCILNRDRLMLLPDRIYDRLVQNKR